MTLFPQERRCRKVSGKQLFRFAIISDTHLRRREDTHLTPWKGQSWGVERAQLALSQIRAFEPEFLIHLGDVVQPVPHMPSYARTAEFARAIFEAQPFPVYYVAGNHDIGDKVTPVSPAHVIDAACVAAFDAAFGAAFYSFNCSACHFIVLNSSLVGSGLRQERAQMEWLKADLAANDGKRIFLNLHYPIYIGMPDEPSYYDNVEMPGRAALLDLIETHKVEAVFAGHVHNPFLDATEHTDFYTMLSTCFVRHDYTEMFHVGPGKEFGRDDEAKLGWAEIEVYETGHVLTYRRMMEPAHAGPAPSVRAGRPATIGAQLRSAWAEMKPISINGPVDEFVRRRVRNDYEIVALWETGLEQLRAPLSDLADDAYFARMRMLLAQGHRFTFYTTAATPLPDALAARVAAFEARVELVLQWVDVDEMREAIAIFRQSVPGTVGLACTVSASDHRAGAFRGGYVPMSFGFDPSEIEMLEAFHAAFGKEHGLNYAFRFGPEISPLNEAPGLADFLARTGTTATINLVQVGPSPAAMPEDEVEVIRRLCEAQIAGAAFDTMIFHVDTLLDQDRGYFPRKGLYDLRINPGAQARAIQKLAVWLAGKGRPSNFAPVENGWRFDFDGTACTLSRQGEALMLDDGHATLALAGARPTLASVGVV